MQKTILLSIFLLLLSACHQDSNSTSVTPDFELTKDFIIVCDTTNAHLFSTALILQKHLHEITGNQLEIQPPQDTSAETPYIFIGNNAAKKGSISYKRAGKNVHIIGDTDQYARYAVYDFLTQQLNCHWLSPTVDVIPEQSEIKLPGDLSYQYQVPIHTRTVHSKLFYNDSTFADQLHVTHEAFPGYIPEGRVHTFHRLVPEKEYFKSNPTYFALRNGQRIPAQLCLTNPDVYEIMKTGLIEWFNKYPSAQIASISQDDNQQYCQCKNCEAIHQREESPAGSIIELVNQLAMDFPDKIISTLAYQYSRKAPKHLKPAKNVLITLCSIECDRSGSIEDKCQPFAEDLIAWGKLTNNIRIWDYTTQFTNFLAPFPNLHTLQPNLSLFEKNNTSWVFEQHSHNNSELFELRSWLLAKLLWKPSADADSLIHVFCNNYYEEAAPFIEEYIQTVHTELKKDSSFFLFLYGDPSQGFRSFLKADLLSTYDQLFDKATEAVALKKEVQQRVETARLGIDLAILEACRKGLSTQYALQVKNKEGLFILNKAVEKRLDRFIKTCQTDKIEYMNENRFMRDDYESLYRATIARASQPNYAFGKKVKLLTKAKKYAAENPQALTDGAFGGNSFYANWLGFEGNDLEAIIDLEEPKNIQHISTAFLQYVNHIVFLPTTVSFYISSDGVNFELVKQLNNPKPLNKKSRINFTQTFTADFAEKKARYIKVKADNMDIAPLWHHGTGLPSWIFIDEVIVH